MMPSPPGLSAGRNPSKAMIANTYAHHIDPTILVRKTAILALTPSALLTSIRTPRILIACPMWRRVLTGGIRIGFSIIVLSSFGHIELATSRPPYGPRVDSVVGFERGAYRILDRREWALLTGVLGHVGRGKGLAERVSQWCKRVLTDGFDWFSVVKVK